MQTENSINFLPVSSNATSKGDNAELGDSNSKPCGADPQEKNLETKEKRVDVGVLGNGGEDLVKASDDVSPLENNLEVKINKLDVEVSGTGACLMEVTFEAKEVLSVVDDANCLKSEVQSENGCAKERSPVGRSKREESPVSNSLSSAKKAKIMVDEEQPSVKVMFNFLTRDSKRKLEELLQHWSEWHAKHRSLSHDSTEVLESGEQTYFPAILNDSSAVSFWMDDHMGSQHNQETTPLNSKSVPLYDRGYSWALTETDVSSNPLGGLEMIDSSRCFNCGAYDHALRDCPKPRDNAAVSKARKEHNSRRNQNAESRNPTRYYQDSSGGKFDGLKPGALDAETRKLLGLGDRDPPPWLNRMREIGYPPGYLDPDEDQPSGILIFGDEEHKEQKLETEDGEILDTDFPELPRKISPEPPRKMSVQFPGINAPIPEKASESQWSAGQSSSYSYTNRSHRRGNNSYHEQRSSSWYNNDLDASYSFHMEGGVIIAERSSSSRGRWSPSAREDSVNDRSYKSRQGSPPKRFSSQGYGSSGSRRWDDDRRNDSYLSRDRDRDGDRDDPHNYRRR